MDSPIVEDKKTSLFDDSDNDDSWYNEEKECGCDNSSNEEPTITEDAKKEQTKIIDAVNKQLLQHLSEKKETDAYNDELILSKEELDFVFEPPIICCCHWCGEVLEKELSYSITFTLPFDNRLKSKFYTKILYWCGVKKCTMKTQEKFNEQIEQMFDYLH